MFFIITDMMIDSWEVMEMTGVVDMTGMVMVRTEEGATDMTSCDLNHLYLVQVLKIFTLLQIL